MFRLSDEQHSSIIEAVEQGLGVYLIVNYEDAQNWRTHNSEIESAEMESPEMESPNIANSLAINSLFELAYLENQDELRLINWGKNSFDRPLAVIPASISTNLPAMYTHSLMQDQAGNSIIERIQLGKGTVALSLLPSSYAIKTQGSSLLHSQLWQFLIKNIARKTHEYAQSWRPKGDSLESIIRIGGRISLCHDRSADAATTDNEIVFLFHQNGIKRELSTRHGVNSSYLNEENKARCTQTVFKENGWYDITSNQDNIATHHGFVYSQQDWYTNYTHALNTLNNLQASSFNAKRDVKTKTDTQGQASKPMEKLYFWLLLVMSLTLLWIERVMNQSAGSRGSSSYKES
jgi:hypothetical protein